MPSVSHTSQCIEFWLYDTELLKEVNYKKTLDIQSGFHIIQSMIKFNKDIVLTPYQFNPVTQEFEESEYECTFGSGEVVNAEIVNDETGSLPFVDLKLNTNDEVHGMIAFGQVHRNWFETFEQV